MGDRDREAARDLAVLQGHQLEREVRVAMPGAGIKSVAELARQSRVQRDTLYAWFRGDQPPKPATLQRVAEVLGLRLGDLWNYDPPVAPPAGDLAAALNALAAELREWRLEDRERIAELEAMVDSLYRAIRDAADSAAAGPRPDPLELHEPR